MPSIPAKTSAEVGRNTLTPRMVHDVFFTSVCVLLFIVAMPRLLYGSRADPLEVVATVLDNVGTSLPAVTQGAVAYAKLETPRRVASLLVVAVLWTLFAVPRLRHLLSPVSAIVCWLSVASFGLCFLAIMLAVIVVL